MDLLGHRLSHNASVNACWAATRIKLWSAFYANPGNKRWHHLPSHTKATLLDRFCLPVLLHRCSRWPANKTLAERIDSTQRKMMTLLLRTPPLPEEALGRFAARKSNIAATVIRHFSRRWSSQWFSKVASWDAHCERHPGNLTTKIKSWRGDAYLRSLQQPFVPQRPRTDSGFTMLSGRLDTRRRPGRPPTRWQEGVRFAEYDLQLEAWRSRQ